MCRSTLGSSEVIHAKTISNERLNWYLPKLPSDLFFYGPIVTKLPLYAVEAPKYLAKVIKCFRNVEHDNAKFDGNHTTINKGQNCPSCDTLL